MRKTIIVYVDGFALYKEMLQRNFPHYKWLNLELLCQHLFPLREVVGVKYFTAPLKPMTNDPGIGQRQQIYWDALRSTEVEIIEGKFIFTRPFLPKHPEELTPEGKVVTVQVKRPEEKGSDVALASHLIFDAVDNRADSYALMTNDSDLAPTVAALIQRGIEISLISVAGNRYNKAFNQAGVNSVRQIREGNLKDSQFPERIWVDEKRTIKRPASWA